jgi:hypothetical protein
MVDWMAWMLVSAFDDVRALPAADVASSSADVALAAAVSAFVRLAVMASASVGDAAGAAPGGPLTT